MFKKYCFYLLRWQMSTPILAIVIFFVLPYLGTTGSTVLANFIGGLIFFWFDRWLFSRYKINGEWWEVAQNKKCHDCGIDIKVGYRLIKAQAYNKIEDKEPEFRCKKCRDIKYKNLGKDCPLSIED